MQILTSILMVIVLLLIVYFDFRYMAIPLYLIVIALIVSIVHLLTSNGFHEALSLAIINIAGSTTIILTAFLVVFLLHGKLYNPINSMLGAGDILFLPVLCFSLSPLNFIVFFIASLSILLAIKTLKFRSNRMFPLAGGQSVLFVLALIVARIGAFDLYDDSFMLQLIYP